MICEAVGARMQSTGDGKDGPAIVSISAIAMETSEDVIEPVFVDMALVPLDRRLGSSREKHPQSFGLRGSSRPWNSVLAMIAPCDLRIGRISRGSAENP
jgi:hypothetical protein